MAMKRTSQSDYGFPLGQTTPTNKLYKGHVTVLVWDKVFRQSVEFVYGIDSDFLFDGGHLGICNTAVLPLYSIMKTNYVG